MRTMKKREAINYVKELLSRQFVKGAIPLSSVEEWKERYFQNLHYVQVYTILHEASDELIKESGGRVWYCHNILEDTWRFHEGKDDLLVVNHGTERRIGGYLKRQSDNWEYSTKIVPEIKNEIYFNDTKILAVEARTIEDIKGRYENLNEN